MLNYRRNVNKILRGSTIQVDLEPMEDPDPSLPRTVLQMQAPYIRRQYGSSSGLAM